MAGARSSDAAYLGRIVLGSSLEILATDKDSMTTSAKAMMPPPPPPPLPPPATVTPAFQTAATAMLPTFAKVGSLVISNVASSASARPSARRPLRRHCRNGPILLLFLLSHPFLSVCPSR